MTGFIDIRTQPAIPDCKWVPRRTFRVLGLSDSPQPAPSSSALFRPTIRIATRRRRRTKGVLAGFYA
jgi:hypothetical protein